MPKFDDLMRAVSKPHPQTISLLGCRVPFHISSPAPISLERVAEIADNWRKDWTRKYGNDLFLGLSLVELSVGADGQVETLIQPPRVRRRQQAVQRQRRKIVRSIREQLPLRTLD